MSERRKPSDRGVIGKTAVWFDQAITQSGNGDILWIRELISLVEFLDELQAKHPNITLSIWARDCIWIHVDGIKWIGLRPNSSKLRILTGDFSSGRDDVFMQISKQKSLFQLDTQNGYRQWFVEAEGIQAFKGLLSDLSIMTTAGVAIDDHPRYFPGSVREAAYQQFEFGGRWCPGVDGKVSRHKVKKGERIEYDHILPFSRGGTSTAANLQILCRSCNSTKRATAL